MMSIFSIHWKKRQVHQSITGTHGDRRDRQPLSTCDDLELSVNLICMFLVCGENPSILPGENPCIYRENMQTLHRNVTASITSVFIGRRQIVAHKNAYADTFLMEAFEGFQISTNNERAQS